MNELEKAFLEILNAAIEYQEYEHDGDPWKEDARTMGEMDLDYLDLDEYKKLAEKLTNKQIEE